jgi:hypothetical protein
MGVLHQMGHDSRNLLGDYTLSYFGGAILSPVDDLEQKVSVTLANYQRPAFECLLDPQLYYPKATRGKLPQWEYYPQDVDTADLSSRGWWSSRAGALAKVSLRLNVNAVCSPAITPRSYSAAYYDLVVDVASELASLVEADGIEVLPTVIVHVRDLASSDNVYEIASIVTKNTSKRVYLIFVADVEPRREITQTEDLVGAMRLIRAIEGAGVRIVVGYTSSDILLWKTAGAASCATGKFFNLRRFTPSRWDPPSQGGGQLPYWFEESVLAFIREADILRLRAVGMLSEASDKSPYCATILEKVTAIPHPQPWLKESWRQYMYWFQTVENRMRTSGVTAESLLDIAEENWRQLNEAGTYFEEPANDGRWVKRWKQAIFDYMAL